VSINSAAADTSLVFTRWRNTCLSPEELLRLDDDDWSPRQRARAQAHLARCSGCRDRLEALQSTLETYRAHAIAPLHSSTASWDRTRRFRQALEAEVRAAEQHTGTVHWRRWVPAAAAIGLVLVGLFTMQQHSTIVEAEELLARAALQERGQPSDTIRSVEIRLSAKPLAATSRTLIREIGRNVVDIARAPAHPDADVAARFARAGFDWHDPLNVGHFRRWRAGLAGKHERIRADNGTWVLTVDTEDGPVREAMLAVQTTDYAVVAQRWVFEDQVVEIVVRRTWTAAPPAVAHVPPSPAPRSADPPLDRLQLEQIELAARRDLHELKGDLDPRVTIQRASDVITIGGATDASLQSAIQSHFTDLPQVRVVVSVAAPSTPSARAPVGPGMAAWITSTFRGGAGGEHYVPRLTAATSDVDRHVRAFAALADRYPDDVVRQLSPQLQADLQRLVAHHLRDLRAVMDTLDEQLALIWGTPTRRWQPSTAWQSAAHAARRAAASLEPSLHQLLDAPLLLPTINGPGRPDGDGLRDALDALWQAFLTPVTS